MDTKLSSRFKDAKWFTKEDTYCIIGGAGGIGSWLGLLLARAGFLPIIYDFDFVEEHNIGGQLFQKEDINKSKVIALKDTIENYAATTITANEEKYTDESMSHHYVFSAFDNMQARKDMFNSWKEYVEDWKKEDENKEIPIFIDGRLLMEQLTIFCVTPENIDKYEKYLFDDSEVAEEACTLKQTSHSAAMIASHMVGFFTNHITNNVVGEIEATVPFMWEYFIPINYINEG